MFTPKQHVESILRNWNGQDASERLSAGEIARQIDAEYQEYLSSLPQKTAVILAGHSATEKRLAS